jgi:pyrroline-5-carboxylate reductase
MTDPNTLLHRLGSEALLVAGGGNMGCALIRGWLAAGLNASALQVIEPHGADRVIACGVAPGQILPAAKPHWRPQIIVLAVKPQMAAEVCEGLIPLLTEATLVVSILAGLSRRRLSELLGGHARIVRTMPNTPAAIGAGSTVLIGGDGVDADDRAMAATLMAAVGSTHWVDSEAQMDAVTAVSGSGPAYVFHLIECLAAAAHHNGLPAELANALARETVIGAALLAQSSPLSPEVLRQQVTSPGGTTEAGLDVLMRSQGLAPLIRHTVEAAARRSRELGK